MMPSDARIAIVRAADAQRNPGAAIVRAADAQRNPGAAIVRAADGSAVVASRASGTHFVRRGVTP